MENDASQIRRLMLTMEGTTKTCFDALNKATKLRAIFFPAGQFSFQGEGIFHPTLLNNKCLRVIHGLVGANRSPKTISFSTFKFKHMRYLDLIYSNLEDVHAESFHQLYNLQTLNLESSQNVQNILKNGIGSLINLRHLNLSHSDANHLPDSITRLTNLKNLDICYCERISVLPINIGHLQNLSSLDISSTSISELPDSISLLYNLTKFNFRFCEELKSLPRNFGALTQLRSLDLTCTHITELPESLTSNICKLEFVEFGDCKFPEDIKNWVELRRLEYRGEPEDVLRIPRGIEKLTRLEVLWPYIVRKEDDVYNIDTCSYNSTSSSIQELAHLNSLRKLRILNLENLKGGKIEAETANLKDKQNIQILDLQWKFEVEENEEVDVNNSVMVLEGLQPHPHLKELTIAGFPGLKLPKWIGSSSCLPNLVELNIYYCKSCTKLVGLGQLPCLQLLTIGGMNSVKCLGKEFYYQQQEEEEESKGSATTSTRTLFPSLTRLYMVELENLKEWFAPPPPDNSFPSLEKLEILECRNLTSIPDLRLWTSSLTELHIVGSEKLEKKPMEYYLGKSLPYVRYNWSDADVVGVFEYASNRWS